MLAYWAVFLALMKSVVNNPNPKYLLCIHHRYMLVQRYALSVDSFEYSIAEISMTTSAFTDYNARAYDAIIPVISGTLAEQALTATIKNEKYFRGFTRRSKLS